MENTMMVSQPQTTQIGTDPVTPTVPDISLDPMDFQKELAKIAAEQGMVIDKVTGNAVPANQVTQTQPQIIEPVQAVTQPAPTPAAAQPQTTVIPEKFRTAEGQPDVQRIEKSYLNAEEALRKYQEKEIELRRKQAEVQKLAAQTQYVQPQQNSQQQGYIPPAQPQGFSPSYINERLNSIKDPGAVIYEAANLAYIQAKAETEAEVQTLRNRLEAQERNRELERIAKEDPWVLSNEGVNTLAQIRSEYPHLNASPNPWSEAYDKHLAIQARKGHTASVYTPTPNAQTVKAPPTPVNANAASPSINLGSLLNDQRALNSYLDSLPNDQARAAFWRQALPGANKGV